MMTPKTKAGTISEREPSSSAARESFKAWTDELLKFSRP
jgi:hypothetical protein